MNCNEVCEKYGINIVKDEDVDYFLVKDVARLLHLRNPRETLQKYPTTEKKLIPFQSAGGQQKSLFLTFDGVKRIMCTSRSHLASAIAKDFGITVTDQHFIKAEAASIGFLIRAFKHLKSSPQHPVLGYRIDLYFPDHRVAIECDEEGSHGPGRVSEDKIRERKIIDHLSCTFVRFRPERPDFDLADLIQRCTEAFGFK